MPRSIRSKTGGASHGDPGGNPTTGNQPPVASSAAIADYILELSGELSAIADQAQFRLLAYLLDMARIEADLVKKRLTAGSAEPKKER